VCIVPEIDLPGHTLAAIAAYPELGNDLAGPARVWTEYGIGRRVLNVEDSTVDFFRHVLDEVVDVFPGPYVHLGGDEVAPDEWLSSPAARRWLNELDAVDPAVLLGWWIGQLADHLLQRDRTAVVWHELSGPAPKGCVLMTWRDGSNVDDALRAGHDVVTTAHADTRFGHPESPDAAEPLPTGSAECDPDAARDAEVRVSDPEPTEPAGNGSRVLGTRGDLGAAYAPALYRAENDLEPRLAAIADLAWGRSGFRRASRRGP
jgi:hexosaminidase